MQIGNLTIDFTDPAHLLATIGAVAVLLIVILLFVLLRRAGASAAVAYSG